MPQHATYKSPAGLSSDVDNSGTMLAVGLVGLILSICSVAARGFVSYRVSATGFAFHKDDYLCLAALVIGSAVFALNWAAVSAGYGRATFQLQPNALGRIQQIVYSIELLSIISLFLSRISVVYLLVRIRSSYSNAFRTCAVAGALTWAFVSVMITALRCDLLRPWDQCSSRCSGLAVRWYVVESAGIMIELSFLVCVLEMLCRVRMRLASKAKILVMFGTRLSVIAFAILRLLRIKEYITCQNSTYTGVPAAAYGLLEMYVSIITATTPLIKSFLHEFKIMKASTIVLTMGPSGESTPRPAKESKEMIDPGSRLGRAHSQSESSAATSSKPSSSTQTSTTSTLV